MHVLHKRVENSRLRLKSDNTLGRKGKKAERLHHPMEPLREIGPVSPRVGM